MDKIILAQSTIALVSILPTLFIAVFGGVFGWACFFQLLVGFDNPTFEIQADTEEISMEQALWLAEMVEMDDFVIEASSEIEEEDVEDCIKVAFGPFDYTRHEPEDMGAVTKADLIWDNDLPQVEAFWPVAA